MRVTSVLISLLVLVADAAASDIYVVKGHRGSVTFTSRRPASGEFEVFKPAHHPVSFYRSWGRSHWSPKPRKTDFDELITQVADDYSLEPSLLKAVMHVESAFNPRARSKKGAMGLMQLMPDTAKRFGVWNAYHPEQNVKAGAMYLKWLLQRYNGDERLALAAYNAGEGRVDSYGRRVPPFSETQTYVKRVAKMKSSYQCFDKGITC
jgi:soluble lytic murein transglycosylase-like protein